MSPQKTNTAATKKHSPGFTLVELIVVITILAILGTIGFMSIGGYSSRARDSDRLAEVANLSKSLDLSVVTMGSYPTPDNSFAVTYSGSAVWNQGIVGTNVLQAFKSSIAGGGINKKPVDPLDGTDYVYSSLAEGKAYQIMVDYEGDLATTAISPFVSTVHAAPGAPTIAYIRGNYGGLAAKVSSGSTVYIIAIPSIITNTGTTVGGSIRMDVGNALSGTLLISGKNLKNANSYNPGAALAVAYSGAKTVANPSGLPSTPTELASLVTSLKNAYTGSLELQASSAISSLLTSTGTTAMASLGSVIVSGQLGGNASGTSTTTTLTCNSGYVPSGGNCVIPTSCKALKDAGTNTDGVYVVDPDGAGGNASFSIYCDMTTDGGGWSLVYKNLGSTGLAYNNMVLQGSTSCLENVTNNCSAKLNDTVINLMKSSATDEIWYRTSSPSIANRYFWPGACVYRHDSIGNSFWTHPTSSYCTRYTATFTTSTNPTYIQCILWGGHGAGLNAWFGCAGSTGSYTNVSITHRGYTENWGMTTNAAGAASGTSDTSYGNSTYMWVR